MTAGNDRLGSNMASTLTESSNDDDLVNRIGYRQNRRAEHISCDIE